MENPSIQGVRRVVASAFAARAPGGIRRFIELLSTPEGEKSYRRWREDPMTALFLGAIRDLADSGILPNVDPTTVAVEYGYSCGVHLAGRLIDDPTRVFPAVFDGDKAASAQSPSAVPDESYSTSPDPVVVKDAGSKKT